MLVTLDAHNTARVHVNDPATGRSLAADTLADNSAISLCVAILAQHLGVAANRIEYSVRWPANLRVVQ